MLKYEVLYLTESRQAGVHISNNMRKQFIKRFQDKLDKTSLSGTVRRFLRELPGLGVEVDVTPESPGELVHVDVPVGRVVERGEGFESETGSVL